MTLIARVRRALRILARKLTFVADVAHRADVIEDSTVDAIAIDTVNWCIALNPAWCSSLADDDMEFVLAHELFHVFLRTGPRGTGADAIYWNFAHDMVINQRLVELFGRPAPRGGVVLPSDDRVSAETVYLRTKNKQYLEQLHDWAGAGRWQVDAHPDASGALSNARSGHAGAKLGGVGGLRSYVAVEHEGTPAGERDVVVETARLRRPWPVRWLEALGGSGGTRGRSWMRPSRRGEGGAGRHRKLSGELTVIFDVTPSMLAHAEHVIGNLRAFAIDNDINELRLLSVDETGVVADQHVDAQSWTAMSLPRAVVIQRSSSSELVNGVWVCGSCHRPHATTRSDAGPPALDAIDSATRSSALVVTAPSRRRPAL